MDAECWARVRELFEGALEQRESERAAWLAARTTDAELLREIEALFDSDRRASGLSRPLAGGLLGALAELEELGGLVGCELGSFRLLRRVAAGGMGVVFEAEQASPRRKVAVKVLRLGLDTPDRQRRFEYESEVLARLRHPCIAQVYESGAHSLARNGDSAELPWFAMEFVEDARHLVQHADDRGLSASERVELFLSVCDAIHHGHQRGVVHRDLKPANVLVDGEGRVKVIDFGIALSTEADVAAPRATSAGEILGTLRYMSPEQLEGDRQAIDARTDVYALGLVLYELLCGELPYELDGLPLAAAVRRIQECAPILPSARDGELSQELDWILLRALEKDPDHRYTSAHDLGLDLRRHLRDEPVEAGPPSTSYRMRKFCRRHRAAVTASAAAILALIASVVMVWLALLDSREQTRLATEARAEADEQAAAARSAQALAEDESQRAQLELDRKSAVVGFLRELLTTPERSLEGAAARVVDVIDAAPEALEQNLAGEPAVAATLFYTLGQIEFVLRRYERAIARLERALELFAVTGERDAAEAWKAREWLARAHSWNRELDLAEEQLIALIADLERRVGREDPEALAALRLLVEVLTRQERRDEAAVLAAELHELFAEVHGETHPQTLLVAHARGSVEYGRGEYARALEFVGPAFELAIAEHGPEARCTQMLQRARGMSLLRLGRREEAIDDLRRMLEATEAARGPDHVRTLNALNSLAAALRSAGRAEEARALLETLLERRTLSLGVDHEESNHTRTRLAAVLRDLGLADDSLSLLEHAIESDRSAGRQGQQAATALNDLGCAYVTGERYEEGVAILREAAELRARIYGEGHDTALQTLGSLGASLRRMGELDEAEAVLVRLIELRVEHQGATHPDTIHARFGLAQVPLLRGESKLAAALLEAVIEDARAVLPAGDPKHLRYRAALEACAPSHGD